MFDRVRLDLPHRLRQVVSCFEEDKVFHEAEVAQAGGLYVRTGLRSLM